MLTKEAATNAALVIPIGNPLAKFLVCFLAKIVGVSFVAHVGAGFNVQIEERAAFGASLSNAGLGLLTEATAIILGRNDLSTHYSVSTMYSLAGRTYSSDHDVTRICSLHESNSSALILNRGYFG